MASLNNDEFGDYLIYHNYQSYKVFFDGRSDMYGTNILREYDKVVNFQPGWEGVLEKYRITWIFIETGSALSRFLLKDGNWVLIYSDKVANIFVRNLPQYKGLVGKYHQVTVTAPDMLRQKPTPREIWPSRKLQVHPYGARSRDATPGGRRSRCFRN